MKFVKIYSAVLFFYFLTGSNLMLIAQKSTLFVGESLILPDISTNGLKSQNGKYMFNSSLGDLAISNLHNSKHHVIFTKALGLIIKEIKVTEGTVTLTSFIYPVPGEPAGPDQIEVIWGDKSKGGKYTRLVMQDDGALVLYSGTAQGGNGDVIWKAEPYLDR